MGDPASDAQLVADIKSFGVGPRQPVHSGDQIGPRSLDDQVKMVSHQAVGVHLPICFSGPEGSDLNYLLLRLF